MAQDMVQWGGCCENCNEPLGSVYFDYQIFKDCNLCSSVVGSTEESQVSSDCTFHFRTTSKTEMRRKSCNHAFI